MRCSTEYVKTTLTINLSIRVASKVSEVERIQSLRESKGFELEVKRKGFEGELDNIANDA